jgi:predicted dehydrogenase
VKAFCGTVAAPYEAEDSALVQVRFQSGMFGSLECFFGTAVGLDEFAVLGTEGRLVANPLNGDELVVRIGSERRLETHPLPKNLHSPLIADFVAAIHDNREPLISGVEGRKTNEVMEKAYRHSAHG